MWFAITFLLIVGGFYQEAGAAGGDSKPSPPAQTGPSIEEQAVAHYNDGLKHRDKAWEHEEKAAVATKEKNRKKYLDKASKEYAKAVADQLKAVQKNPRLHQAFSSLGYAYRKLGKYDKALQAYDTSLKLDPTYTEAIEYRAEAYLGLNRVAEAQGAYESLFSRDPARAGQLLTAMKAWAALRAEQPVVEVSAEKLLQVESWIAAKEKTAEEMGGTGQEGPKEW